MKELGILYKKMKRYFQKLSFKILDWNFKKITFCIKNDYSIINSRIIIACQMKGRGIFFKKIILYFQIYFPKIFDQIFEKLRICIKMPAPPSLLTVE